MQTIGQIAASKCLQMAERTKNLSEQENTSYSTCSIKKENTYSIKRNIDILKIRNISRYINTDGSLPYTQWQQLCNFLKYAFGCYGERSLVKEFTPAGIIAIIEETAAAEQEGKIETTAGQYFQGTVKKIRFKQAC